MRGWKADATPNGKCAASLRVTKIPDFSFLLLLLLLLLLRALGAAGLELGWAQIFRGRFVLARQGGRRRGGVTTTTTTIINSG